MISNGTSRYTTGNHVTFHGILGRHGSDSLCRDERENKMVATYMY